MTIRTAALASALLTAAAVVVACGSAPKVPETVSRNPVIFESDDAEELFEGAAADRYDHHGSRNTHYNREIDEADADGDGIITEDEAQHYAE
jgi:hypothetical protein